MKKFFGLTVLGLAIAANGYFYFSRRAVANSASYQINTYANPRPPVVGQFSSPPDGEAVSEEQGKPTLEELLKGWEELEEQDEDTRKQVPEIEEHPRFRSLIDYAVEEKLYDRPMPEIMQAIADYFIGYPYQANLLDGNNEEKLVITLDGFDCVLFVETVLAIARSVAVKDYSYSTFTENLSEQRYWKGERDGYCSRLHYFSEWISDNDERAIVENIGRELGGLRVKKSLYYMSQHRWSYPPMASNEGNYRCIVNMEDNISRLNIDYIPHYQIRSVYSQLKPGDIIAVATEIGGLDVTHTGLVYRLPDGNIGLIHASPAGQVTIARDLQSYIWNVESAIGILVARPVDPRGL